MGKRTSIYLNPPLDAALEDVAPGGQSRRLGVICDRYAEICRRARVAGKFSAAQMNALRDCSNGTSFEPASLIDGSVLANFCDALLDGIAEKWGIDADATRQALAALTYPDQVALVEEIEKFWRGVSSDSTDE